MNKAILPLGIVWVSTSVAAIFGAEHASSVANSVVSARFKLSEADRSAQMPPR